MFFVAFLRYALHLLVPLSLILSSYLYFYPVFHQCAFPSPTEDAHSAYLTTLQQHSPFSSNNAKVLAPFRLLALGDPQLEGDSSIDYVDAVNFPNLAKFWKDSGLRSGEKHSLLGRLRHSLHDLIDFYLDDIPKALEVYRKRLDHFGNDYYLGHVYRTLHWWANPTHVTVLGDLVGSQWIDDEEFEHRGWRFWNRVFKGGVKVPEDLYSEPSDDFEKTLVLGEDAKAWKERIINVAGNHDIGYAGDISQERMTRFTRVFGKANYELRFQMPVTSDATNHPEQHDRPVPELRIIILNDMNLDTPADSKELQEETYGFLNKVITTSQDVTRQAHFTLVLTHIPMYKPAGVCFDGPFFNFFDGIFGNGVKEQNHLSLDASKGLLEGIFGMSGNPSVPGGGFGRHGVILNGHDHEGCDVFHFINHTASPEREWESTTWKNALSSGLTQKEELPNMREITVRSMMGAFEGNAGLMSLWFDESTWEWQFEFANCQLGAQHIWWIIHIVDLITLGAMLIYAVIYLAGKLDSSKEKPSLKKGKDKTPIPKSKLKDVPTKDREFEVFLKGNGNLATLTTSGKKSLRKKKSKLLSGGSPNGSIVHTT